MGFYFFNTLRGMNFDQKNQQIATKPRMNNDLQVEMLKIDDKERSLKRQAICRAVLYPKRKEQ